jgi:iron(III) transport system substrate-binding protein
MAAGDRDPDGYFAVDCLTMPVMGYNPKLVKPEEAPKSLSDLLDPKWKGKLVKAHPGYSGTIVTSTLAISKLLGWEYFEKPASSRSCRCNRRSSRRARWCRASGRSW